MAVEIVMPRLSDSMEEGTIVRWLAAEGDDVVEGQPLVEVETDKASVTYESEHEGVLASIRAREGDSVPVGGVIAVVGTAAAAAGADSAVRVKASPLARRIAAELRVDLAGLAGTGPQGRVVRADVERAANGGNGPGLPVRDTADDLPAEGSPGAASRTEGSAGAASQTEGSPGAASQTEGSSDEGSVDQVIREPLTRRQQLVARRMAESRATIPDFELRCEVDMSEAVALREQIRRVSDPPPSHNDFVVKAAALALREHPRVNASYRDGELERHARVNVGIAVAAPDALLVPTIFDADSRSLVDIATTARELADKARNGSLSPSELAGGTFTVSNLGMYGVDSFSAVVNPPQGAILAVGSCRPRPVVDDSGAIVARPTIHVALACDHRILYGADGACFLARLRELLERPLALLLD